MNEIKNKCFRISVIIPTYKRFDFLKQSLRSALLQNFSSFEIVIADDGSPDFPNDKIEQFIIENNPFDIMVKIFHAESNIGTVNNLNHAIANSCGEIIVILAFDDCFSDDNVLTKISEIFDEEKCDILFCRRMECNSSLQPLGNLIPNDFEISKIEKEFLNCKSIYKKRIMMLDYNFGSGSAMYYSKTFFVNNGCYDSRYRLWEDGPFIAKVMRNGCKYCLGYDVVSVNYRTGGISANSNPPKAILEDYVKYFKYEYEPYKKAFTLVQRAYIDQIRKRFERRAQGKESGIISKIITKFFYLCIRLGL